MGRIALFLTLTFSLLAFCSCGNKHSKEYRTMQQDVVGLQLKIQDVDDCDELQMLSFSIVGLRSDLDNLQQQSEVTEAEISELGDLVDGLDAAWRGKVSSLDCNQYEAGAEEYDTSGEEDYPDGGNS